MSSFEDIFNSFFGKPGFHRKNQRDDVSDDEDDQNAFTGFFSSPGSFHNEPPHDMYDDDDEGPTGRRGPFPRGGVFFSFDNEANDFFRLFDDIFKSFGVADFPPLDVTRISPPPPAQPEGKAKAPRDLMLKDPDSRDLQEPDSRDVHEPEQDTNTSKATLKEPLSWFDELKKGKTILSVPPDGNVSPSASKKVDSDLDGIVRQGEMERIFGGGSPRQPTSDQPHSSYSRSVSIQTIRRPDGTYETRRTERDDKGNVTTTVNTGADDDVPSPGRTEPRTRVHPWGMHPWRSSPFWPGTRRCPGSNRGQEEERGRTDEDIPRPWRPGMFWPGSRRRCPGQDRQQEEIDETFHQKFFGSWFKH